MGKGSRGQSSPATHAQRDGDISDPPNALISVAELGVESAMLTNVIDTSVGPIINLIDQLRAVGIEKDIQIPQIAVMGDQSWQVVRARVCQWHSLPAWFRSRDQVCY